MADVLTGPEGAVEDKPGPTELAPPAVPAMVAKVDDLEALRTAVVDAAGVSFGLWVSYLFVLFYLLVAAGGVTHRDLFFESPVKLPFLNVDLPLKGFFWLGPALFLVVHAYLLLHFVLFAGKVRLFDIQLRAQIEDPEVRTGLRRQLPSNIFVQYLAGPREVRDGILGFLLWLIALISLVIGPVALLVFFQLQFLPYHDEWITWWQRIAVVIDLALLWTLWPRVGLPKEVSTKKGQAQPRGLVEVTQRIGTIVGMLLISVVSVLLVFTIATFPGEWLERSLRPLQPIPLRHALVEGEIDLGARKPKSLWSNRLVLPGLDVIDRTKLDSEVKIAALAVTASLRARHLEGAVLIGAGLSKVDFTAAHLEGARLESADLRAAKFGCGQHWFEGEDQRNDPTCAQLQGASLDRAQLQGALLDAASLQGASLDHAELQGALLDHAELMGASLKDAHLEGASLNYAELQVASLDDGFLQGAWLEGAQLQGASLRHAHLEGAWLNGALLLGVSLQDAHLEGASLSDVVVWRADAARVSGATIARIHNALTYPMQGRSSPWSANSLNDLKRRIGQEVPEEGRHREATLARIGRLLDPNAPLPQQHELAERWDELQRHSATDEEYEAEWAKQWRLIGCSAQGAPYVLAGIVRTMESLSPDSVQVPQLAAEFLKAECDGASGLPDIAKQKLKALRDRIVNANPLGQFPNSWRK
jgi:uncharacterized protein YjbI with pentapeptide repeats